MCAQRGMSFLHINKPTIYRQGPSHRVKLSSEQSLGSNQWDVPTHIHSAARAHGRGHILCEFSSNGIHGSVGHLPVRNLLHAHHQVLIAGRNYLICPARA